MFLDIPHVSNQPTTNFRNVRLARQIQWKEAFRIHGLQIGHGCITMKQMISSFLWLPTKTVNWTVITLTKHLSSMDFRTRRMLVLPSRNMSPQSAIGIDKNEQSDYLTCIQRKNRRTDALDLRGQNSCSIFSGGGSKHIWIQLHEMPVQ